MIFHSATPHSTLRANTGRQGDSRSQLKNFLFYGGLHFEQTIKLSDKQTPLETLVNKTESAKILFLFSFPFSRYCTSVEISGEFTIFQNTVKGNGCLSYFERKTDFVICPSAIFNDAGA